MEPTQHLHPLRFQNPKRNLGRFLPILLSLLAGLIAYYQFSTFSVLFVLTQKDDTVLFPASDLTSHTRNNITSRPSASKSNVNTTDSPDTDTATDTHVDIMDPDPDAPWPRIALLASFPNSGTTYTLNSVLAFSGYAVGTNYKADIFDTKHIHVPRATISGSPPNPNKNWIRSQQHQPLETFIPTNRSQIVQDAQIYSDSNSSRKGGPYWLPGGQRHLPHMKSYILTKTHCAGYCFYCPLISTQRITLQKFHLACTEDEDGSTQNTTIPISILSKVMDTMSVQYSFSRVVRLIRDPLDNIVSRFHHDWSKLDNVSRQKYPKDSSRGFRAFCRDAIGKNSNHNEEENSILMKYPHLIHKVPCFMDFIRYTQWHNLMNRMIHSCKYPHLNVYYDDFESRHQKWNTTMAKLLSFLHLQETSQDDTMMIPAKTMIHPFESGKTYHDFYSKKEIHMIWSLIEQVATKETWALLKRYYHHRYNSVMK